MIILSPPHGSLGPHPEHELGGSRTWDDIIISTSSSYSSSSSSSPSPPSRVAVSGRVQSTSSEPDYSDVLSPRSMTKRGDSSNVLSIEEGETKGPAEGKAAPL
jgi:hypothetical protein